MRADQAAWVGASYNGGIGKRRVRKIVAPLSELSESNNPRYSGANGTSNLTSVKFYATLAA